MNVSLQSVADRGGVREREREKTEGGREGEKKSRSHKTEGLESIIRQQFFLSNHFPKREEA